MSRGDPRDGVHVCELAQSNREIRAELGSSYDVSIRFDDGTQHHFGIEDRELGDALRDAIRRAPVGTVVEAETVLTTPVKGGREVGR